MNKLTREVTIIQLLMQLGHFFILVLIILFNKISFVSFLVYTIALKGQDMPLGYVFIA